MQCTSQELGIVDDERRPRSLISLRDLHVPVRLQNLIPFVSMSERVQSYEDASLQQYIRSAILPLEDFNRRISRKTTNDSEKRDLLLLELLRWFKEDFFTWFDRPTCERCQTAMAFAENTTPTAIEREQGDAQRVELYR